MQIYMVGGAVRDALLGLPVQDRDWVLVGAEPQQLMAMGYLPVGKDFPVFLHPHTREEYALARTERKTAPGYRGFAIHAAPDVTLEQDLARRDLTINAMAVEALHLDADGSFNASPGTLTDPFHGQRDLQARVLRHVTDAFREDPVRILRVARFAARFADFAVAPETMALMRAMVADGEAAALVAERVWQELARGLMEATPSRMLEVLDACGALASVLPEVASPLQDGPPAPVTAGAPGSASQADAPSGMPLRAMLDRAAHARASLPIRFALLCLPVRDEATLRKLCQRLRIPIDCRDLAILLLREHGNVDQSLTLDAAALVQLLERCDAFRKPARFIELLWACEFAALAVDGDAGAAPRGAVHAPRARLLAAHDAAQSVATEAIAVQAMAAGLAGPQVGAKIQAARVAAVAAALSLGQIRSY